MMQIREVERDGRGLVTRVVERAATAEERSIAQTQRAVRAALNRPAVRDAAHVVVTVRVPPGVHPAELELACVRALDGHPAKFKTADLVFEP